MPIEDVLAKLFGSLISVNVDKSSHIHLDRNFIQIDDKKITDLKKVKEIHKEIEDGLKEYADEETYPANIIHKDLFAEFRGLEALTIKEKESLKKLKEIFGEESIRPILLARSIHLAIEEKKPRIMIEKLLTQLDKDFPGDGKKILNLISAGYFDELIIPMIEICKRQHPENYNYKFKEFYYSLLQFFPTAIFVNNDTSIRKIISEINKRFRLRKIPYIRIHTIGKNNIKKVDEALDKLKTPTEYDVEKNTFTTNSGLSAQTSLLKISKNRS